MDDLISRQAVEDAIYDYSRSCDVNYAQIMEYIDKLPSVNPQANKEDIHREREQAYMKGYEDASKRYRTEPCGDAISRTDAIRVASGYCHWSNIPKELAKLPSVNPKPCGDAISRQEAIDAMATWDWQELYLPIHFKQLLEDLPSVSTEKTGRWIPVSERLPEYGTYLICTDDGYIATIMYDRSMGWLLDSNIIAWMPLPQPYKGESEE